MYGRLVASFQSCSQDNYFFRLITTFNIFYWSKKILESFHIGWLKKLSLIFDKYLKKIQYLIKRLRIISAPGETLTISSPFQKYSRNMKNFTIYWKSVYKLIPTEELIARRPFNIHFSNYNTNDSWGHQIFPLFMIYFSRLLKG